MYFRNIGVEIGHRMRLYGKLKSGVEHCSSAKRSDRELTWTSAKRIDFPQGRLSQIRNARCGLRGIRRLNSISLTSESSDPSSIVLSSKKASTFLFEKMALGASVGWNIRAWMVVGGSIHVVGAGI